MRKELILLGMVLFIGLVVIGVVSNYHMVNTGDGIIIVRKGEMTLNNTYINVSQWDVVDFIENPHISKVLLERGYEKLTDSIKTELEKVFDE